MKKALIAMSGGVDSSVAAFLMQQDGFDCIGCTMKLYDNEDAGVSRTRTCCSLDDVEDARSVAFRLHMPYYVFNFTADFRRLVMEKFAQCYARGVTPNPCIDCNRYMKFDLLYRRAAVLGCGVLVTGHYARIEKQADKYILKKASDASKDQSYVLYAMTQAQLAHTRFPLGSLHKTDVRRIALENGFINADKPDSQDICFVPDGDYAAAVERICGQRFPDGDFVSADGSVIGRHKGIIHYTVGQRKGLGIASSEPYYVCGVRACDNTVRLGRIGELYRTEADAADFNWIGGEAPQSSFRCSVKLRYRQPEQPVTVVPTGENTVHFVFGEPQRAVTPGQAAVLYDGDIVLGGGTLL
ncbi:MAG: tRNA 2-thiouridine(34) synthase MnmA [Clostridia bacterium]|nr:tRNA 2-thiouridine(34) synthase MnmA [Clostridia bacterium]